MVELLAHDLSNLNERIDEVNRDINRVIDTRVQRIQSQIDLISEDMRWKKDR